MCAPVATTIRHLEEQVPEIVQSACENELSTGVFHDVSDLAAVGGVIAVVEAVLAGRLRGQWTRRTLVQRMSQQLATRIAQLDGTPHQGFDVVCLETDTLFIGFGVLMPAVDPGELGQSFQVTP